MNCKSRRNRLLLAFLLTGAITSPPPAHAQIGGAPEANDYFGAALAAGDFNGDGAEDLSVGADGEDVGSAVDAGAVHVVYGVLFGGLSDDGDEVWTQDAGGVPDAAEPGDEFGYALAVGDFDGDGYDDLAIGAPGEGRGRLADVGQLHVLYGSASGLTSAGTFHLPQLTLVHTGKRLGAALAAGDFDGDGDDELAVGVPGQNLNRIREAGALVVYRGTPDGLVTNGYQVWHQNVVGIADRIETEDHFGFALSAGDFDGEGFDGYDDLAIGVPFEDLDGVANAGAVHVLYGTAAGLAASGSDFWYRGSPGVEGSVESDQFGYALAAGQYQYGGFYEDLAVGSPAEGVGSAAATGAVHVFYGADGGLDGTRSVLFHQDVGDVAGVADDGDNFGLALAAGNFSGGFGGLAIGVPGEDFASFDAAGGVNVLNGTRTSLTTIGSQLWWQGSPGLPGTEEDLDNFGAALAAGDFDGDTRVDLAVGVPGEDVGSTANAGAVNVLYGSATGLSTEGSQIFSQGDPLRLAGGAGAGVAGLVTRTPAALALPPASPNPFRGATTLRFSLPEAGAARLTVYDALGREVAVLVDEGRAAGEHAVPFDAAALPAGTYLVRLEAAGQPLTQRVTLLR